nr:hypothetical protein [Gluconobacter kondonii]
MSFPWCAGSSTLSLLPHIFSMIADFKMLRIAALLPVACMEDEYVRRQCDAVVIFVDHTMNAPHA